MNKRFFVRALSTLGAGILLTTGPSVLAQAAAGHPAAGPPAARWAEDVSSGKVLPEYPRPQMVRTNWANLNGLWDYAIVTKDAPQPLEWQGRIVVPFPVESALSGVTKRVTEKDRLWYRRAFQVPQDWSGRKVLLHFGAVDWEATVFVNGKQAGAHRGGYDGFSFDITDLLNPAGTNELTVAVWDPTDAGTQPRGKQVNRAGGLWHTPSSGIWQTVWLEPVNPQYIHSLKITPNLEDPSVIVQTTIRSTTDLDQFHLRVEVLDNGAVIKSEDRVLYSTLQAESEAGCVFLIQLSDPKLWSPNSPYLYGLRLKLHDGDKIIDEVSSYFGMRKISLGKDENGFTRMLLNHQPLFQLGALDPGFWPDGLYTAPTDEALRYDLETVKKLGFNLVRKHAKVEPERWYYWCDKLGLLVWQDMPNGDQSIGGDGADIQREPRSARQYETELQALVEGRGNHPSIVLWVPFNEGWGQFDTARIAGLIKRWDPTRLVDAASGGADRGAGDINDLHSIPGPGSPRPEKKRATVLGEFGGLGWPVSGHAWRDETNGSAGSFTNAGELTAAYVKLAGQLPGLMKTSGLSAAVYVQAADVESEVNGLMTSDRAVLKMDSGVVLAANQAVDGSVPYAAPSTPVVTKVNEGALLAAMESIYLATNGTGATHAGITLSVKADKPGARINPAMWGIFFEDINFGADGGLYAELVKNRSFEFPNPWMGWSRIEPARAVGSVEMRDYDPFDAANPHYVRVRTGFFGRGFGVANEGFRGMGLHEGERFNFSVQARALNGKPVLRIALVSPEGRKLGSAKLSGFTPRWQQYTAELRAAATEPKAHLTLTVEGPATLDLDMISLFPEDTWKHRPNGLRADLVQMLADLKPGFLRFPGGCIVEGRDLTNRYEWKNTIGDLPDRQLKLNRWNVEFKDRAAPDYYQSFGLGFLEYFQLCEDLGAAPLPILNCGMACQFNTGQLAPLDKLDPYIQDALDLIEFANAPVSTEWGGRRAALGHPAPFRLKLLGIGNEQWGPQYLERFARFAQVLKSEHPEIQLVAATGPDPDGARFDYARSKLGELEADFLDEHFYRPPEWFLSHANRYDQYDRNGPKVFAGEYAAQVPTRANNMQSALAEAAMMTGFERNADVVRMASYAPLFAHADAWQWRPDLIWFDNLRVAGTPNYYVQQLFSRNRGDVVLPVVVDLPAPPAGGGQLSVFASASRDDQAGEIILKVVNVETGPVHASVHLQGVIPDRAKATETILTSASLNDANSLANPVQVVPETHVIKVDVPDFDYDFPAFSMTVLRIETSH